MLWFAGGVALFTVLSFAAAMVASQIMAVVQGTPVQSALEDHCKQGGARIEALFGYHPLNHRTWRAILDYPAMPPETLGKQRTLRVLVTLQTILVISLMIGIVAIIAIGGVN